MAEFRSWPPEWLLRSYGPTFKHYSFLLVKGKKTDQEVEYLVTWDVIDRNFRLFATPLLSSFETERLRAAFDKEIRVVFEPDFSLTSAKMEAVVKVLRRLEGVRETV